MANINNIIQEINTNLPDNNAQSITAKKLRDTLIGTLYGTEEDYDISANNNGTKYINLTAALGTDGVNVPTDIRKGGMTVRFINNSNEYEQWRYTKESIENTDFADDDNWDNIKNYVSTTVQNNSDLDITDENGNVLVRFANGGIETKNFDSVKTPSINDSEENSDLDITDENGNVLVRFANGGIETKNFNSSSINFNFNYINLTGIYNRDNIFGVNSNIVYKDAAKRTLPDNIIPLVIIAGQSNADGRAPYDTAANWESTQWLAEANYSVENYYMWNVSKSTFETYNVLTNNGADAGSGSDGSGDDKFSFDPFFAKKFIDTFNVPVYAVRETLGGIGIEDYVTRGGKKNTWQPKIGYIEQKYSVTDVNYLVLRLLEKINNIKEWCDENNKILFPIAILWHQGEHDSRAELLPYFKENTEQVISFIRGIHQTPALPFICGFVQKDYNSNMPLINQAFVEISQIDPYMKAVDMEGHYTSIGDRLHYDGQALAYMGDKMFDYYYGLNSLV